MFENAGLEMEFGRSREEDFGLNMCLTLRSQVGFKVGPSFIGENSTFSTLIQVRLLL